MTRLRAGKSPCPRAPGAPTSGTSGWNYGRIARWLCACKVDWTHIHKKYACDAGTPSIPKSAEPGKLGASAGGGLFPLSPVPAQWGARVGEEPGQPGVGCAAGCAARLTVHDCFSRARRPTKNHILSGRCSETLLANLVTNLVANLVANLVSGAGTPNTLSVPVPYPSLYPCTKHHPSFPPPRPLLPSTPPN